MLKVGNQAFEVMEPTDPRGSLARFLEQRGEGLHHINLQVSDLDSLGRVVAGKGCDCAREGAEILLSTP